MKKRTTLAGAGGLCSALLLVLFTVDDAAAQPPTSPTGNAPPVVNWRATAGVETFSFRDIAKSRPPVDGSPVAWRGQGPAVTVDYSRRRPFRLHRFELTASSNGGFVYDTGVGVTSRGSGDGATFVFGQYDYRRYLARMVGLNGLRAGVGVRGLGGRRMLRHTFGGGVELSDTTLTATGAFVATLRFARTERVAIEAEWTNGSTLAHGNQHHAADTVVDAPSWGGGWLTEVAVRGDVRLSHHLAAVAWLGRDGEGLMFNLRSHTSTRARFLFGASYAR
jgi:hypothetical protein